MINQRGVTLVFTAKMKYSIPDLLYAVEDNNILHSALRGQFHIYPDD